MRHLYPYFLLIVISIFSAKWNMATAQDYYVTSFDIVPTDLTARTNPRVDANGRPCAVIKIYVKDAITTTNGLVIGEIVDNGMEKWVYVAHDAKKIELLFKEHMPLYITFNDFNYPTITGQMTYLLKLKDEHTESNILSSSTKQKDIITTSISKLATSTQIPNQADTSNKTLYERKLHGDIDPIIQKLIKNMIYVEGGSFKMGAKGWDVPTWDGPVHDESVESFHIGKYEVTQKEWQVVMGNNPSYYKGEDLPVESVSWNDCQEFIRKLNELTGMNFRLPTESEWEFAARGGLKSKGYKFSGGKKVKQVGWCEDLNANYGSHKVGLKDENELGLFDMSGNVFEWTSDNWTKDYTSGGSPYKKVTRGGSWRWGSKHCCVWDRVEQKATECKYDLGLRLVF